MSVDYVLPEGCSLGLTFARTEFAPYTWGLVVGNVAEAPLEGGIQLWAWGHGDLRVSPEWHHQVNPTFVAVEYETATAQVMEGFVKVPRCRVVFVSSIGTEVADFIRQHTPPEIPKSPFFVRMRAGGGKMVSLDSGGEAIVGNGGTAIVGLGGKAVAGRRGKAQAGDYGWAETGDGGQSRVGYKGIAIAGNEGRAIAGDRGKAIVRGKGTAIVKNKGEAYAWDGGTAIAGSCGTATAGDGGTAIVDSGTARAGDGGTAISRGSIGDVYAAKGGTAIAGDLSIVGVGVGGKAKAGSGSYITLFKDATTSVCLAVGKDGIEPDTFYGFDESGSIVRIEGVDSFPVEGADPLVCKVGESGYNLEFTMPKRLQST